MIQRIRNAFNLTKRIIGVSCCLPHSVRHGKRLIETVIDGFTDRISLGISGLDYVAVSIVCGSENIPTRIGNTNPSSECIVFIMDDIV